MQAGGATFLLGAVFVTTALGLCACSGTGHRSHHRPAHHSHGKSAPAHHRSGTAHPARPVHRQAAPSPPPPAPHKETKKPERRRVPIPSAPVTWGSDGGAPVQTIDVDEEVFAP